jgi:hypothetical protein
MGGSVYGMAALAMSLLCAIGYGVSQAPTRTGFLGEIEHAWRDGSLDVSKPGSLIYASGDLAGQWVEDPQIMVNVKTALLERKAETYQFMESCSGEACKVELGWSSDYVDASKFKTKGYVNQPTTAESFVMAARASIGKKGISAQAVNTSLNLTKPYLVGRYDPDIPGFEKIEGRYQNFIKEPVQGSIRVSFRYLPMGSGATFVGFPDSKGDLTPGPNGKFIAKEGALPPEVMLNLSFWELPKFGYALLALCAVFLGTGIFGLWSARKIERQMLEERRQRDRRIVERRAEERSDRRTSPSPSRKGPGGAKAGESAKKSYRKEF